MIRTYYSVTKEIPTVDPKNPTISIYCDVVEKDVAEWFDNAKITVPVLPTEVTVKLNVDAKPSTFTNVQWEPICDTANINNEGIFIISWHPHAIRHDARLEKDFDIYLRAYHELVKDGNGYVDIDTWAKKFDQVFSYSEQVITKHRWHLYVEIDSDDDYLLTYDFNTDTDLTINKWFATKQECIDELNKIEVKSRQENTHPASWMIEQLAVVRKGYADRHSMHGNQDIDIAITSTEDIL